MPKTSALDHPKFEYCLTIHAWQVKACNNNLHAALMLAYLEDKFNLLLQQEGKPKNKGWMKLNKFQMTHAIFAESAHLVDVALDHLQTLKFIQYNPNSQEFPRGEYDVWVNVNARQINAWLNEYKKPIEDKLDIFEFMPFMATFMLLCQREPETVEVEVIKEKVVKEREKFTEKDLPYMQRASLLFEFWKWVIGSPRSKISDKFLKMIISRIKENYTDYQIAHSFYGLLVRKSNPAMENYIGIKYAVEDSEKLDRMIKDAEKAKFTSELIEEEFDDFCQSKEHKEDIKPRDKESVSDLNKSTGAELI